LIDAMSINVRMFPLWAVGGQDRTPALDPFTDPSDVLPEDGPRLVEAGPPATRSVLRAWDDAITACVVEHDALPRPSTNVEMETASLVEPPVSFLEQTLMAVIALALWGSWEVRSLIGRARSTVPTGRIQRWAVPTFRGRSRWAHGDTAPKGGSIRVHRTLRWKAPRELIHARTANESPARPV
jgi:hypothetical protein